MLRYLHVTKEGKHYQLRNNFLFNFHVFVGENNYNLKRKKQLNVHTHTCQCA